MGIRVNSPSRPREYFLSSPAKSSSFTHPSEVLDWVCFLLEGGSAFRFAPSASYGLLHVNGEARNTPHFALLSPHFPEQVSMDLGA